MADTRKPSDGADVKNDDAVLEEALEIHKLCLDNEERWLQNGRRPVKESLLDSISRRKDEPNYFWSTITPGYDLKKRVLPLSDKIEPSFKPIIQAWRNRG